MNFDPKKKENYLSDDEIVDIAIAFNDAEEYMESSDISSADTTIDDFEPEL